MQTTLTVSVPSLSTITRADWGAVFHRWAKVAAVVLVVPYVAGLMAGDAWHRFTAWVEHHHLTGLARLGLPGGNYPEIPDSSTDALTPPLAAVHLISDEAYDALQAFIKEDQSDHFVQSPKMVAQRLAPAPLAARSIGLAHPRANAVEMMAAGGMSQRAIARSLGISRHRVKAMLG